MNLRAWGSIVLALFVAIGAGIAGIITMTHMQETKAASADTNTSLPVATIMVGTQPVSVEIASTDREREQGLSGHAPLSEGQGMLFVFVQDGPWGFWMKDMLFSLDIMWINNAGTIITIDSSLAPSTYPKVFYPASDARYVLEVPAGYAARRGISAGSKVTIPDSAKVAQ